MTTGLELRILKQTLETLGALLADPPLLTTKLLGILERNEATLLAIQQERGELACEKSEHVRRLREERRQFDERMALEMAAFRRDLVERRKLLEAAEEKLTRTAWKQASANLDAAACGLPVVEALEQQPAA